jgi:tRNA U55 pseudouridine synthase TruB
MDDKYLQTVPLFSSVKVKGKSLRKLARKANSIKYINNILISNEALRQNQDDRKIGNIAINSKIIIGTHSAPYCTFINKY